MLWAYYVHLCTFCNYVRDPSLSAMNIPSFFLFTESKRLINFSGNMSVNRSGFPYCWVICLLLAQSTSLQGKSWRGEPLKTNKKKFTSIYLFACTSFKDTSNTIDIQDHKYPILWLEIIRKKEKVAISFSPIIWQRSCFLRVIPELWYLHPSELQSFQV